MTLRDRAKRIKLLILDVDGVLTDGDLIYGDRGKEWRRFNVQDGFGISVLHKAGIKPIIITAKGSRPVLRRAKEMGVIEVYQNAIKKDKIYEKVLKKFKLVDEQICYVGDDIIDIPVLKRVGLAIAVANAVPEVKRSAHYVTKREGGSGAVREAIELILKAQGRWQDLIRTYI